MAHRPDPGVPSARDARLAKQRDYTEPTLRHMHQHRGEIIVVEDDHSVNRAIRRLLQAAGFRARTFESSEALLVEAPAEQRADCFVIDMQLPGMSGIELYGKLREAGVSAPVVIITAHDDANYRRSAAQMGAAAYITKPFSNRTLLAAVSTAILSGAHKPG